MSLAIVSGVFRQRTIRISRIYQTRSFRDVCGVGKCHSCELLRKRISHNQAFQGVVKQWRCHSTKAKVVAEGGVKDTGQLERVTTPILEQARQGQLREFVGIVQKLHSQKEQQPEQDEQMQRRDLQESIPQFGGSTQIVSERENKEVTCPPNTDWQDSMDRFSSRMKQAAAVPDKPSPRQPSRKKNRAASMSANMTVHADSQTTQIEQPQGEHIHGGSSVAESEMSLSTGSQSIFDQFSSHTRRGAKTACVKPCGSVILGIGDPAVEDKETTHWRTDRHSLGRFPSQMTSSDKHAAGSEKSGDMYTTPATSKFATVDLSSIPVDFQTSTTYGAEAELTSSPSADWQGSLDRFTRQIKALEAVSEPPAEPTAVFSSRSTQLDQTGIYVYNLDPPETEPIATDADNLWDGSTQPVSLSPPDLEHFPAERDEITPVPSDVEKQPSSEAKKAGLKQKTTADFKWNVDGIQTVEGLQEMAMSAVKVLQGDMASFVQRGLDLERTRNYQRRSEEIAAFAGICKEVGMVKEIHDELTLPYKQNFNRDLHSTISVSTYNKVIQAWAKKGDLSHIQDLFSQMSKLGLKPDLQSYVALLECVGRRKPFDEQAAKDIIDDIKEAGLCLEDWPQCDLRAEQWWFVSKVIHRVEPGLVPNQPESPGPYDCRLLNQLNHESKQTGNPFHQVLPPDTLPAKLKEQLQMEQAPYFFVDSIQPRQEPSEQSKQARQKLDKVREEWRTTLLKSLKNNMYYLDVTTRGQVRRSNLWPYLNVLKQETFVELMLQEIDNVIKDMDMESPALFELNSTLGRKVYRSHLAYCSQISGCVRKTGEVYQRYLHQVSNSAMLEKNYRETWHEHMHRSEDGPSLSSTRGSLMSNVWPYQVTRKVGKFLYNIIISEVKVDANILKDTTDKVLIPAFYTVYRERHGHKVEEVKPHPALVKLYQEVQDHQLALDVQNMPTVVPPLPWTKYNSGGYLLVPTDLVKNERYKHHSTYPSAPSKQLYPMFDALNAVSSVPWIINKPILDMLIEVFNSGGDAQLDVPPPAHTCPQPPKLLKSMTMEERIAAMKETRRLSREKQNMRSLWCTEHLRLSIANKYRDEIFWFPHSADFRGRFYAVPPHFNHLGSDLARSILKFAKGKPLGPHGLDWLKIHLVNLTGLKKRSSNRDRLAFAMEHMDDILDSADNAFTGRRWWQTSDEPWQTLACCMEIRDAVRSPDHTQFVSHYPAHQDGSCNGLQHYAALGRDQAGAESVNLMPSNAPSDVYSDVVGLVEAERVKDAEAGLPIANTLEGFVSRKVIKQTIMTTVYGVTPYGARYQIMNKLKDIQDFPQESKMKAAIYLADKTFHCLEKMFTSTKSIQDWLVLCANLISIVGHKPVSWVTPLGWPVVQPYFKEIRIARPASTPAGKNSSTAKARPQRPLVIEKPNAQKQRNAFPPNFIHSLDSAHMMLTSIFCLRAGITFVSVHDCFWTHASDVAVMNKICREQFIALHNEPILEDLAQRMLQDVTVSDRKDNQAVHAGENFVKQVVGSVPKRGMFQLENVLDSTYFFS